MAGAASAAVYAWRESKRVELSETVVRVPDLPPGLDGLRILHVADTHFPANAESLPRFLAAARRQSYDIVVGTGDYVDTRAGWDVARRAFEQLDPGLGVYAVIGGHERYARPGPATLLRILGRRRGRWVDPGPFVAGLREAGVRVLINEHCTAEIGGEMVRFIGVDDACHGLDRLPEALPPAGRRASPSCSATPPTGCCIRRRGACRWPSAGTRTADRSACPATARRSATRAPWDGGRRRAWCASATRRS